MINNKKVLAVIPARRGSKGVPGKNVRSLGNVPLITYSINTAGKSKYIDELIVSTDDANVVRICRESGVSVPFERPAELASDRAPLVAVAQHAYMFFKDQSITFDAVMSIQPTSPFITSMSIDSMIELMTETGCESVTTVAEIVNGHPYIAKRLHKESSIIENFTPLPEGMVVGSRHERETAYYLTGGVYLRGKDLMESGEMKGHCLGKDSRAVVVSQLEAVDINSEIDFLFADFLTTYGHISDNENIAL